MKISNFSAVGMALVFAAAASALSAEAEGTAKVVSLHGAARYSLGDNKWQTLDEGAILKPGTVIQTASDSWVDIVFGEDNVFATTPPIVRRFVYDGNDAQQNVIRMRENTVLALDKLIVEQTGADVVSETQLDLRAGHVFGNIKKLSAASKFEIKLPNGVAGIRGTIFDLSANGILSVFFGSVVISYYDATGQLITKVVMAGQRLDCTTGHISNIPGSEITEACRRGEDIGHPHGPPGGTDEPGDHGHHPCSPIIGHH